MYIMSEYIMNQSSKPRFCLIPNHYGTLIISTYIWTIVAWSGSHRCGVTHTCVNRHRHKLREVAPVGIKMSAPNASERKACWGARDQLWKCLDEFEAMCPAQWVKYFVKQRDFLKYKEKIQKQGYEPTEGASKL
uniref:Cytochrome c oxidase assembly factor 6 n=1 Tax=Sinocyclocheilus rhinocerous TaxID=307959 RepID=A0A673IDV3_9TELE